MYIFLDTETTGLNPETCNLIEVAADTGKTQLDVLIKLPENKVLPEFITELTGITDKDLANDGISEEEALEAFFNMFPNDEQVILVAHNCQFDASFIREAIRRHPEHKDWVQKFAKADFLDTKTVYQTRYDYEGARHRLSDAIERYGLEGKCINSHRAIDDAYALKLVFEAMQAEKDDIADFINVFAIHPKYGLAGDKFEKVTYGLVVNGNIVTEEEMAKAAIDMFNTQDWINGCMTGGIDAPRIILDIRVSGSEIEIDYTYPETCGLSDCRYHDTRAGEIFTDKFSFIEGKIALNGKTEDPFNIRDWEDPDLDKAESEFYSRNKFIAA